MAQILADDLGIPFDRIRVLHGTTSFVDEGYGTYHSRAVVVGGSAVKAAAAVLIEQVLALAARRTGIDRDQLQWRAGAVHRGSSDAPVLTLEELAALASPASPEAAAALEAVGRFRPGKLTYTYGAQITHVAVDPETGDVVVKRLVTVEDVGRAVNPLADYAMPTSVSFAAIDAITLEEAPSRLNPLGAKGAGEGGIVATGAAVANAVAAALASTGAVIRALPLSQSALGALLRSR